jgi:hypothetical protein
MSICDIIQALAVVICTNSKAAEIVRACLKGWPVGSAALPGAHFRVWPPFPLPRPGPLEAKTTPSAWLLSYAIFHRSQRARLHAALGGRFRGALRRRHVALAGSRWRRESSSRPSPSRNPWPIKATVVASSLLSPSPRSRETPARVSWWCAVGEL